MAVVATLLAQRAVALIGSGVTPASRLAVMGSPLIAHEGERALSELRLHGRPGALESLRPLEESGLNAWLITSGDVVGAEDAPPRLVAAARRAIGDNGAPHSPIGFRVYQVRVNGENAIIAVSVVTGSGAKFELLLRGILLVAVPLLICLGLARWFAAPIERLRSVAHRLSEGDLASRVGDVKGPSEATELARTFDFMAGRLQENMESQQRLLRDVSHEVRSPLARIRLATQMLRENKGDPATNMERIERDVARLDELVESLGAVVRTGHALNDLEPIDLRGLVREAVETCRPDFEAKQIEVRLSLVEAGIKGDRRLLSSAVENVLGNAIAYSDGGASVEVELTAPATLLVLDSGPGVPAEDLENIFEPFYRVADSRERRTGGVGLGLSIVKRVVAAHGGRVWAENRPSGGLAVTIVLGA